GGHHERPHQRSASEPRRLAADPEQNGRTAGLTISGRNGAGAIDPAAVAPLFVEGVQPGGLADGAGVKAGDEITAVDDIPPFIGGQLVKAVSDRVSDPAPDVPVWITL